MGDQQLLFQEPENILQNPLDEFSIDPPDFSALRLYSSPPSAGTAVTTRRRRNSPCSSCGCSSHSRKRPSISGPNCHHHAKKLFLETTPPPETHHSPSAVAEPLLLRRTFSDSLGASGSGISSNASPARATLPATPGSASNSGRPPLPPTLRRCVSDPIPSPPTESKSLSRTSSSSAEDFEDTPSSKRSKMLGSWREFNRYMEEEFMGIEPQTEEIPSLIDAPNTEENYEDVNEHNRNVFVNTNKDNCMNEFEESLSVERVGERLNIHFKCPCGNAYQFLLVDGNCFYKLM